MTKDERRGTGMQLMLVEMIFAIGFFAVIAAVCVSLFAGAWQTAAVSRAKTGAVSAAVSAAECFKAAGGDAAETAGYLGAAPTAGDTLTLYYNDDWETTDTGGVYRLEILFSDGENGLHCADITVFDGADVLFALSAASAGEVLP